MRIVAVGEKLENLMFEIVRIAESLECETAFFKGSGSSTRLGADDIVVIASDSINVLNDSTKNTIVTVAVSPCYQKKFSQEIVINASSIKKIYDIVEAELQRCINYPIATEQSTINLLKMAEQLATTDATILITGETGTGKEVIARYIHEKSNRSAKNFIPINCAAIPDTLLESELFGHERGAFTNAIQRRLGKFEEADHGTILLDEISEMSLSLQAKILRILQEREFSRLGSNATIRLDLRIIATSNRDLKEAVQNGLFREDLFYRLNVIPMKIPNLANRKKEIAPLARFFCKKYSNNSKKFSEKAIKLLEEQKWRGNVRELENIVHRSVLLSRGNYIDCDDIVFDPVDSGNSGHFCQQKTLKQIETELMREALDKFGGNKIKASEALGTPIRTLRQKVKNAASDVKR
ncbi:MAG: sigma-54 dependent transcriptional regulator [Holosporaceae bacterium]|jgi:DNA-binding NtrC family response regulator|nr:sigma-54 dependent transcriptional regulator [Holosporaceae bacterium]